MKRRQASAVFEAVRFIFDPDRVGSRLLFRDRRKQEAGARQACDDEDSIQVYERPAVFIEERRGLALSVANLYAEIRVGRGGKLPSLLGRLLAAAALDRERLRPVRSRRRVLLLRVSLSRRRARH
ncbi:MAG TPA: hypothetical protein VE842_15250 [Pyrinomonadaceae bacterium]|nr:hypothetical protein [Pyrinomonadaceae bacterium]